MLHARAAYDLLSASPRLLLVLTSSSPPPHLLVLSHRAGTDFTICPDAPSVALRLATLRIARRGDAIIFNEGLWHKNANRTLAMFDSLLASLRQTTLSRGSRGGVSRGDGAGGGDHRRASAGSSWHADAETISSLLSGARGIDFIWRETSPQHFTGTPTGAYPHRAVGKSNRCCSHVFSCGASKIFRRNEAHARALTELEAAGLPVLRIWDLSASQWNVHVMRRTQRMIAKGKTDWYTPHGIKHSLRSPSTDCSSSVTDLCPHIVLLS